MTAIRSSQDPAIGAESLGPYYGNSSENYYYVLPNASSVKRHVLYQLVRVSGLLLEKLRN